MGGGTSFSVVPLPHHNHHSTISKAEYDHSRLSEQGILTATLFLPHSEVSLPRNVFSSGPLSHSPPEGPILSHSAERSNTWPIEKRTHNETFSSPSVFWKRRREGGSVYQRVDLEGEGKKRARKTGGGGGSFTKLCLPDPHLESPLSSLRLSLKPPWSQAPPPLPLY